MAINQKQVLSLQQKLSPQQIQMIKLLELLCVDVVLVLKEVMLVFLLLVS